MHVATIREEGILSHGKKGLVAASDISRKHKPTIFFVTRHCESIRIVFHVALIERILAKGPFFRSFGGVMQRVFEEAHSIVCVIEIIDKRAKDHSVRSRLSLAFAR